MGLDRFQAIAEQALDVFDVGHPAGRPVRFGGARVHAVICAFHGSVEHDLPITPESSNRTGILWLHTSCFEFILVSSCSLFPSGSPPLLAVCPGAGGLGHRADEPADYLVGQILDV